MDSDTKTGGGFALFWKMLLSPVIVLSIRTKKKLDAEREVIEAKLMAEGRVDLLAQYGYLRK